MKKISTILALIALFVTQFSYAGPDDDTGLKKGSIAGRIVDENNVALPGASIIIPSIHEGAVSDQNGYYRIAKLDAGKYEVVVSYIGYESIKQVVEVQLGKTSVLNFTLESGIQLSGVEIVGTLQGQSKAFNQQKNSTNVTNVISSDQVGRFPDANVGDAIKRIPGINVQYDQGEARFGHVRGTSPELNSVTINGERIPSAEAEVRAIQLDLIPSEMIQSIEVSKVVTPDMDADAIGGSVNLVTKSPPSRLRISGSIGSGYNFLPEKAPLSGNLLIGQRFANNKLGMVVSASYHDNPLGSDNIEAEWEKEGDILYTSDFQVRTYEVRRKRQSYSAAFDYKFNANHKIELSGIFNHRKDWENRFRLRYKDIELDDGQWVTEIRRETKGGSSDEKDARLEDQKTMDFSLKGEHFFGSVEMDWKASYGKASEDRPHERYISFREKNAPITFDLSDPRKPEYNVTEEGDYGLKELTQEHQYTDEIDKRFKMKFKIPLKKGLYANKVYIGAGYKAKDKKRDNEFYDIEPLDEDAFVSEALTHLTDKTKTDFLAGDYVAGSFVDNKHLGNLNLGDENKYEGEVNLEEIAGNYNATENVLSTYVRFDQKLGENLKIIAGVRMEKTDIENSGKQLTIDEEGDVEGLIDTPEGSDSYTNILPSLIAKYSLSKNTSFKFAVTNTIARPKYYDLVNHVIINQEDNEIELGNPALEATKSMNLDLMFEHYFQSVGIVSAGLFYKSISDFIVDKQLRDIEHNGNVYDKLDQPINAGDANLYGFEFAIQRQFDFLDGFWKQFGVYANYTYTHSEVKNFAVDGREDEELPLPGTPENIVNTSLFYESKTFSARLSLNFADDFIDEVGDEAFYDRYYDKVTYLDANASYTFNKHLTLFVKANNLLNTPLRYYQGESDRIMQAEYYNMNFNFGVKFDL